MGKSWYLMPFADNPVVSKDGPWWCERWEETGLTIMIKCPHGHLWSLINHRIDKYGKVDPAVKCTKCQWIEYIHLDNCITT